MRGFIKLGIALTLVACAAGVLLIAASGARERGRLSYCRNNLRKLGEMAFPRLGPEERISETGRSFWQEIRREYYTTFRGGVEAWVIREGGANPFGCPVRGIRPLDLSEMESEALARHMSDPGTIDYRGPRVAPASTERPEVLGGDLEGNHRGGGGHVLLVDLSVRAVREALQVLEFRDSTGSGAGLAD